MELPAKPNLLKFKHKIPLHEMHSLRRAGFFNEPSGLEERLDEPEAMIAIVLFIQGKAKPVFNIARTQALYLEHKILPLVVKVKKTS